MCPKKKLNHISKYFLKAGTSRAAPVHGHDDDDSEGDDDDDNSDDDDCDDDVGHYNNDDDVDVDV